MSARDDLTHALLVKLQGLGPERVTLEAQAVKLQDEVLEVLDEIGLDPVDPDALLEELADVVIVAHTAARIAGFRAAHLDRAVIQKMERNAAREWFRTASGTARHSPEVPFSGTNGFDRDRA